MKIAFAIRPNYLSNRGGDTFQFLKTKKYLEMDYNDEISIITNPEDLKKDNSPIVHVFNLQTADFTLAIVKEAKKLHKKICLSPIIWHFGDAQYVNHITRLTLNLNIISRLNMLSVLSEKMSFIKKYEIQKTILQYCDAILPNSEEEECIIKEKYKIKVLSRIVPNCIDSLPDSNSPDLQKFSSIVLEVGRIEPTKNQLGVLLALMDHKDIPLFFIGKQNNTKKYYIDYLKELGSKRTNTFFIDDLPQEDLISYYKAAKVHVLPSFRESPGLVTLEALYYNTNVVVSEKKYCPVSYYQLDKYGYICNPYSVESIRNAILNAYYQETKKVPNEYFSFYHYKNAAKMTHNVYDELLSQ